ncbi:hypothetical protein T05_11996 [Trichinella murrelli]|uniref:Uncharacterized protein n=1 Tax=Trichinella murrelli TaxID=144512 RepID=A0A0V0T447_9BILA|nr:hypothetical protein T05_11996 [Trichinella murrelli]
MAQRNHRTEHNIERELRSLACHGCVYTSMVACRSAFRRKYARVVSFRSRYGLFLLTPVVICKPDSPNVHSILFLCFSWGCNSRNSIT